MNNPKSKGIFWLASYPKSGNTWVRAFLAQLTQMELSGEQALDINKLSTGAIGSSREWVQHALGFDISELTHDEIDALRPKAYQWLADNDQSGFHKIHDAYGYLPSGEPLIPSTATRGALYLVRNPFDVAVSYANHNNLGLDEAIAHICDPSMAFCDVDRSLDPQLRQIVFSWSDHVESWLSADLSRLCMRYEDLKYQTQRAFKQLVRFFEIPTQQAEIARAIELTSFERLSQQEQDKGFFERYLHEQRFFRSGTVGDWQSALSDKQVSQIIDTHSETMKKLGYIDDRGDLTELCLGKGHPQSLLCEELA